VLIGVYVVSESAGVIKAVVIVNGDIPQPPRLQECTKDAEIIICADGAANTLRSKAPQTRVDFLVGDFDSASEETRSFYEKRSTLVQRKDQDSTDLEKALELAVSLGATHVAVTGISGGRYDHVISNLHSIDKFISRLSLSLFDESGYGHLLNYEAGHTELIITEPVGTPVSLLPLGTVKSVTTQGLEFPLCGESLSWAKRSGQSNRTVELYCSVSLVEGDKADGSLLVYVARNET
jgi:thiamine pyrophosphokinase